ncbi:hypothetical protein Tco_1380177, partial [Tanacetum coccineum]
MGLSTAGVPLTVGIGRQNASSYTSRRSTIGGDTLCQQARAVSRELRKILKAMATNFNILQVLLLGENLLLQSKPSKWLHMKLR